MSKRNIALLNYPEGVSETQILNLLRPLGAVSIQVYGIYDQPYLFLTKEKEVSDPAPDRGEGSKDVLPSSKKVSP